MKRSFLIVICLLLLLVGCGGSTVPPQEDVPPEVEVPWDVVNEICREIAVYSEWCYENNISQQECINQIIEKVPRVFNISNEQFANDVLPNCG